MNLAQLMYLKQTEYFKFAMKKLSFIPVNVELINTRTTFDLTSGNC